MRHSILLSRSLVLTLAPLAGVAGAQDYGAAGPHLVGWRNEPLPFEASVLNPTINNRVYYPALEAGASTAADPSAGPYPLVCLIHGATAAPSDYDVLSSHVASYGYVVASVGAMASPEESYANLSRETKELADWVVAESADPLSVYAGLVADGDFGVIGSSRGGGACALFVGIEPRVRAAALLEPSYVGGVGALGNLAAWDGSWLFVGGELDMTNPPQEVKRYRNAATGAERRVYVEIQGAGHAGALDPDVPGLPHDPLPHAVQLSLHLRFTVAFLEAQMRGREDAYHQVLGSGATADAPVHQSTCKAPILWAVETGPAPGTVELGLAGDRAGTGFLAVAANPASISTPYGILGLDPATMTFVARGGLGIPGTLDALLSIPPGLSGRVFYTQGISLSGGDVFTRTDTLVLP